MYRCIYPIRQPSGRTGLLPRHFGLELIMDHGWLRTCGIKSKLTVKMSSASQGGCATPDPGLTIEVASLQTALARVKMQKLP